MSGIVGFLGLDGRLARAEELERMVEILAHRGPDGRAIWCEGSAGLGHCMLHTTPESLHERLPFQRDGLVITADARIDNREELIDGLQLKTHQPEQISDSELILNAYQKWGENCPAQLVGDFAFAIWDINHRTMFCARDHMGFKPLYYYHRPNCLFSFASEIKGLLAVREIPCELNETRIADFLTVNFEDRHSTFFKNIYRLPAARWLKLTDSCLRIEQYWKLEPDRELRLPSDREYEEAFLDCFSDAITARLRCDRPVGSLLSGGLDSSSIVCLARQILARRGTHRLHTFSAVFPDLPDEERAMADERPFIDTVLAQGNLNAHFINTSERSPLGNISDLLSIMDEPYIAPNIYMHWGIYQVARQAGIRILLDGFGGDSVISHGSMYLTELARTGQWEVFSKEIRALASSRQVSSWPYLKVHALDYLTELALAGCWHAFFRNARALRGHFSIPAGSLIMKFGIRPVINQVLGKKWGTATSPKKLQPADSDSILLNSDFARRIGYDTKCPTLTSARAHTQRADQYVELNSAVIPVALEEANKAAAALGMDTTFPYLDRRLMEFCLAIPGHQKLRDGWGRSYMRRALKNILPEEIRWRHSKGDLSPNFRRGFLHDDWRLIEETMQSLPGTLGGYINISTLQAATVRYHTNPNSNDELIIWKIITLALWMTHFVKLSRPSSVLVRR